MTQLLGLVCLLGGAMFLYASRQSDISSEMKEKFGMIAKVLFVIGVVLLVMGSSSCPCRRGKCNCCRTEEGYDKNTKTSKSD